MLAAILVQTTLGLGQESTFAKIGGEWVVFMCLSAYMLFACMKAGIWDRRLQPNIKTNLVISGVSGFVLGAIFFVATYFRYNKLAGSIATGIYICGATFILTFVALSFSAVLYKKRVEKLESEVREDSEV